MVDPLIVDTARVEAAGDTLRSLVLPPVPATVTVTGTDAMSAAINETMPVVEAPVIEGMPVAQAALEMTATKIVSAATKYADADRSLGGQLGAQQFPSGDAPSPAAAKSAASAAVATAPPAVTAGAAATAVDAESVAQLSQFATTAGSAVGSVQGVVQSIQGAVGGMSGGSASLAGPQDEEETPASSPDGAASGDQAVESVPLQSDAATATRQPTAVPAPSGGGGHDIVE